MKKYIKFKRLTAITIVEVLIAGGILSMALASSVALNRSINRKQAFTSDRNQAYALASEGLEIIRNMRDSTYVNQTADDFDSFIPAAHPIDPRAQNCRQQECNNLELILNSGDYRWTILTNSSQDTDRDSTGEVIVFDLNTGNISDSSTRIKNILPNITQKCDSALTSPVADSIIYCRKISIKPVVYDISPEDGIINSNDGVSNENCNLPNNSCTLPWLTDADPMISGITFDKKNQYTFDALWPNARKIIVEVTWYEHGQQYQIDLSDIITNWRWL